MSVEIFESVSSPSPPTTMVDETITFSIKMSQSCEVKWYIDGDLEQTNSTLATSSSFTTSKVSSCTYTVKAVATNTTTKASDSFQWEWKVNAMSYYSDNRIWDEYEGISKETYTWNPPRVLAAFTMTLTLTKVTRP